MGLIIGPVPQMYGSNYFGHDLHHNLGQALSEILIFIIQKVLNQGSYSKGKDKFGSKFFLN